MVVLLLALAALGREAEAALQPLPKIWLIGPLVALAGFILLYNASVYFIHQANNFASWNAFSSPETIVGRKMAELGPDYTYFMSPFLANHPSLNFLAPDVLDRRSLSLPDALPIRVPPTRPFALFIHPDDAEEIGLSDGDPIELTSPVGTFKGTARVSVAVRPGTLSTAVFLWGDGAEYNPAALAKRWQENGPDMSGIPVQVKRG